MSLKLSDMTQVLQLTTRKGVDSQRWQRPQYVHFLPPCNHACPAGEDIQGWLAYAQAGEYEKAWHRLVENNPCRRRTAAPVTTRAKAAAIAVISTPRSRSTPWSASSAIWRRRMAGRFRSGRRRERRCWWSVPAPAVFPAPITSRASGDVGVQIIASLNGSSREGWVDFAVQLEQAGASAIELNVYRVPADPLETGQAVEQSYVDVLRAVKARVKIPVAVKLGPHFSSPGNMAKQLVDARADGLVLFSRFFEPDVDLATLTARSDLEPSTRYEMRLPLMWTALLSGKLNASLAAGTGVWTHEEVVKYLLVGADVVMTASSLLEHGPGHLETLSNGLQEWMASRGFGSIDALRGPLVVSRRHADPAAFMRAQYYQILTAGHFPARR